VVKNIFNESINDTTLINDEYESIKSNQNKTVVNVDVAQLLKLLSSVCIIMNMFFKNIYNFKQFWLKIGNQFDQKNSVTNFIESFWFIWCSCCVVFGRLRIKNLEANMQWREERNSSQWSKSSCNFSHQKEKICNGCHAPFVHRRWIKNRFDNLKGQKE